MALQTTRGVAAYEAMMAAVLDACEQYNGHGNRAGQYFFSDDGDTNKHIQ